MRDLGLVSFSEPFKQLFTQGMLLAHCYYREDSTGRKRWFYPAEVEQQFDERGTPVSAVATEDGQPVIYGGIEKMSKSKNNVVEPGAFIERFGADTARAFVMFAGPPDQSAPWSDASAEGVHRFLKRMWSFCYERRGQIAAARPLEDAAGAKPLASDSPAAQPSPGLVSGGKTYSHNDSPAAQPLSSRSLDAALKKVRREVHNCLHQAQFDYQRMQYNTVVSATMKMLNALDGAKAQPGADAVLREGMSILLRTLYPIAPHITHVLWVELGYSREMGDLLDAPLPVPAEDALRQDELELVVQVNGKLRGRVTVAATANDEAVKAAALADEHVRRFVDKPVRKIIVVPGKLINIVV
jgi:leucyl-tRNA synthetase